VVRLPIGAPPARRSVAEDSAEVRGSSKVLVVDANRDVAERCAALLRLNDHQVSTAFDGQHAIEIASTFHPGVPLLDIGLRETSGLGTSWHPGPTG
jgi:CheY-like chemotaxis protein